MKNRKVAGVMLIFILSLFILPTGTSGRATVLTIDALESDFYMVGPPDDTWVSGNVMHISGYKSGALMTGTLDGMPLTGEIFGFLDIKIFLKTGDQLVHGTALYQFDWNQMSGYFSVTLNLEFQNGVISGSAVGHGYEDYNNWKIFIEASPGDGGNRIFGHILIPN